MKNILVAVASLAILVGCKNHTAEKPAAQQPAPVAASETEAPAASDAALRTIDIKISGSAYIPAAVNVAKGEKVRLNFTRDEKPTCGDTVVFPTLNIKKEIPVNQVTSIDITADKPGDLEFTCGMNMLKGKVVVQ